MTEQHDIAEECEHRMDGYLEVDYHGDAHDIVNITELHADHRRYAAHMRQQSARIATLEKLVREAMPMMELESGRWLAAAREAVGEVSR